jgi:glyoxylase-like metal-dependent hydrolase (beta-lactamase superfamily II)/rhodanese-related sulfurtransferase
MKVEQIYTGCLAQGAYYIVSDKEAVIIDPLREIKPYLDRAKKDHVTIKYIFETHFHADFVSGHIDLAKATGATIIYGPTANPSFEAHIAKDAEEFEIGSITIKVLHTPGHTMESSCYLLSDETGSNYAVFTGDTLFIGDVGRPDLAQKAAHLTQEQLAGLLFDSLRTKIMTLEDSVIVYPAHGAGSACGKNMSKETTSTIGIQKKLNYALRGDMSRDEFISEVTEGLLPPPGYFPLNVKMNKEGYDSIDNVLERGITPLSVDAFENIANQTNALVLDTRKPEHFVNGFIPNSINIGIDGTFAPWVGALIPDVKQTLLLITEPGMEEEVVTRLARVGYDHVVGYLEGGFETWQSTGKEIDTIESITATEFETRTKQNKLHLIDVRKPDEFEAAHITDAQNIPLDFINDNMEKFPREETLYLHCAGGYRSAIAASILKSRGFESVINIEGGFSAMKETSVSCTTPSQ